VLSLRALRSVCTIPKPYGFALLLLGSKRKEMASKTYNRAKIVRLTEQEESIIEANAEANLLSVSRYLAHCGIKKSKKSRLTQKINQLWLYIIFHLLLFLIYELKRIGVNINQLVRDYNVSKKGKGYPPEVKELEKAGKDIQKLVAKIDRML
jgi:hypothetical protein